MCRILCRTSAIFHVAVPACLLPLAACILRLVSRDDPRRRCCALYHSSVTSPAPLQAAYHISRAVETNRPPWLLLQNDIDEALRLMRMSKTSLLDSDRAAVTDPTTAIFAGIRDEATRSHKNVFVWSELVALLGRSYSVRSRPSPSPSISQHSLLPLYPRTEETPCSGGLGLSFAKLTHAARVKS